MTRFIHLTDLHVSHPDSGDAGLNTDTPASLRRAVALVNAMDPAPDFLVASGDLTNIGDVQSYRLVQQILGDLKIPVVLALGNHDTREGFHSVFGDGPSPDPYVHDTTLAGLHVITLDTGIPGRVAGTISPAQFDFLDQTLALDPDLPKLIVMHHPPWLDPDGLPWASLDEACTKRLKQALKACKTVGILSGHIHIDQVTHWHGIPVVVSKGLNSTIDLLERTDLRIVEGTGFGICTYHETGLSVSYVPLSPETPEIGRIDQIRLKAFS